METTQNILIMLAVIAVAALIIVIYFIPTVIANRRQCADKTIIFVINLLLGFIVIGWLGAMVWAIVGETEIQRREKQELQSMQLMQARMMFMSNGMPNGNMMNNGMSNGNMMNNGMQNGNLMNNGTPNEYMMYNGMSNGNMMNNGMLNNMPTMEIQSVSSEQSNL